MALLQLPPILAAAALPSHPEKLPRKNARITLSTTQTPSNARHHQLKKNRHKLSAVAEGIAAAAGDESVIQEDEAVEHKESSARYDWTEEWYPLYLTKQVPDDAPLGLTVFDKQVVLFKDGDGVIRCYEDRCPHRYLLLLSLYLELRWNGRIIFVEYINFELDLVDTDAVVIAIN